MAEGEVASSRIDGGGVRWGRAALVCALALACHAPGRGTQTRELTADEFRALLAKGTIAPVREMEGEDAFEELDARMDDPGAVVPPVQGEPTGQVAVPAPPEIGPEPPSNPYVEFGARIKVNPDGTITKPYPLRVGTGSRMLQLIERYGNLPLWTAEMGTGPSTPATVKLELLEKWDIELYQDLRNVAAAPTEIQLADWLVVTTGADLLGEVEGFINLFAAGVPQIEIEAKIVEITFSDVLDLGVKTSITTPSNTLVQGFEGDLPNVSDAVEGLLTLGGVQDGVVFNAILEALAASENVSIISRPKIAVREGGRADITNTTSIPYLKVGGLNNIGGYSASVEYKDVGVKLYVVPRVVGTQTVALNIDVEQSQVSGSETILVAGNPANPEDSTVVQVPVLSTRSARTVVYLQPGQAVILGGLITERTVDSVKKVPLLADIPILGYLFRSKFARKEQTNVLFFIRPRILQGIDLNREF